MANGELAALVLQGDRLDAHDRASSPEPNTRTASTLNRSKERAAIAAMRLSGRRRKLRAWHFLRAGRSRSITERPASFRTAGLRGPAASGVETEDRYRYASGCDRLRVTFPSETEPSKQRPVRPSDRSAPTAFLAAVPRTALTARGCGHSVMRLWKLYGMTLKIEFLSRIRGTKTA
jgi:hypothetical protein